MFWLGLLIGVVTGSIGATLLVCFFIGAGVQKRRLDRRMRRQKVELEDAA